MKMKSIALNPILIAVEFCENIHNMLLVLTCKRYVLLIGTILFQLIIKKKKKKILRLYQASSSLPKDIYKTPSFGSKKWVD